MSRNVHNRVRLMLTLFVIAMVIPWNVSLVSADDGTPTNDPVEVVPTATTEVPVATEVPAEPTATEVPPTAVPPTAVPPTAEPEIQASQVIGSVTVLFELCGDNARIGQVDMQYWGGEFAGAGTAIQCRATQGITVTLTDVNGVNGPYVFAIAAGVFTATLSFEVEAGTYTASYVSTGADVIGPGSFPEQLVLAPNSSNDGYYYIDFEAYAAEIVDPNPLPVGDGDLYGEFASCRDAARDGETDFQVVGFEAASTADLCTEADFDGQISFTISGTEASGAAYGPRTETVGCCGTFEFYDLPFGTYTLTESVYGNTSDSFTVGGNGSDQPTIVVRNYFASEPVYDVPLDLSLQVCEDSARAGQADYFSLDYSEYEATATCFRIYPYLTSDLDVTLFDSTHTAVATEPMQDGDYIPLEGLNPGFYTAQIEGYSESLPFELVSGKAYSLGIILYVDEDISFPPPGTGGETYLEGEVGICVSEELAGQTHYLIDTAFLAASTGECVASPETTGVVFIYRYENSGDADPVETLSTPVLYGYFDSELLDLESGYYRVGYSPSAFDAPTGLSSEFAMYDEESTDINILFFGATVETSILQIRKDICYSEERAGTTDFFFQQEEIIEFFALDTTVTCRVATYLDGTYTFILTDVDTGETTESVSFIFPVALAFLGGIPAGTYTLTEEIGGLSRTSEPFEFVPNGDYSVLVRNYVDGDMPDVEGESGGLIVWAYDCINDEKAGTSEFYYNPGIVGTDLEDFENQGPFAASAVENCVAAEQYEFVLDNGEEEGSGISGAAVYPLIKEPGGTQYVSYSSVNGSSPGSVPAGEYILTETVTGSSSEPISIQLPINIAGFYRFAAAPTPTPSPTNTPEPTGTLEPTATTDPDATATSTAVPGEPTATAPDVTTLPSTGQGQSQSMTGLLQVMLLAGLALILLAAGIRRSARRV